MRKDLEIQKDVREELTWEPSMNASDITISVKNGIVTLSGIVDSHMKKVKAAKAAKRVKGVTKVFGNIEVILPVESQEVKSINA